MIIKSHITGAYRKSATYLEAQGLNEKRRTVEISDIDARTMVEAFWNMWAIGSHSEVQKALHHISINPRRDEHLRDDQVFLIIACCEEKYGYKPHDHQRVVVEHIKEGRQHFHVIWNRVNLVTGLAVNPGCDHNKSIQAAREMEKKLGLTWTKSKQSTLIAATSSPLAARLSRRTGRYLDLETTVKDHRSPDQKNDVESFHQHIFQPAGSYCTKPAKDLHVKQERLGAKAPHPSSRSKDQET